MSKAPDDEFMVALARRQDIERGKVWANRIPFDNPNVILYLGSGRDASNKEKLVEKNVTHVLNVADDVENFFEKETKESGGKVVDVVDANGKANGGRTEKMFTYCNLHVKDFGADAGISRVFPDAVKFIRSVNGGKVNAEAETSAEVSGEEAVPQEVSPAGKALNPDASCLTTISRENQVAQSTSDNIINASSSSILAPPAVTPVPNAVLVHCANGSNRSVSVVIAAKMIIDKCSLAEAFRSVKDNHQKSMPLQDNRKQLMEFERKLYPARLEDEYMDGRVFFDRKKKWKGRGNGEGEGSEGKSGQGKAGGRNGKGKSCDTKTGDAQAGGPGAWQSDAASGTICQRPRVEME